MITNYKLVLLVALLWSISGSAQQDSQYTQYMYNTANMNPAYAGSRGVLSIFGLHRTQWVGLDGAPTTNSFALHSPIGISKVGLGLSFINERIGPSDENSISADFSYTIRASETFKLAFGLKATANLLNIDYTKLDIYDPNDPRFQRNIEDSFTPNIGAGAYLYSENTYVGLSIPNFLETKHYQDDGNYSVAKERMHFYLMGGHVFELSSTLKFKPSVLAKIVEGAPLQADISANFLFSEKLTLGSAYRWDAAVSVMAGFQISEGLFVGYAYDTETTKLATYNSGSHEIFLRFELFKSYDGTASPRFF
ncbi:type IX secretion system PorP/SprF family membrane protein [Flavobacterium endophyticum]|uniref:Type IX secretion system PorP/SprF family membrane protein n=1 Tax=Flavobacterium endophyticum TaxID=1540163 RepID=A0A495MJB3_9FLAO|nr:type IX secretion system membrane protein PorP/SprF [Flavobacterium endophyticum]RKS26064.1 type IX secretion system PorP/SprF family membrane protein [Flavobacterium endophyticum]